MKGELNGVKHMSIYFQGPVFCPFPFCMVQCFDRSFFAGTILLCPFSRAVTRVLCH